MLKYNLFHFTLTETKFDSKKEREFKFNPLRA